MKKRLSKALCLMLAFLMVVSTAMTGLPLTAQAAQKAKLKLSQKTVTLYAGEQTTVSVKSPKKAKEVKKIKYAVSDKKVASVSRAGKIKAKKKGTATITATYKGKSVNLKLKVTKGKQKNPKIVLKNTKAALNVGQTTGIKVKKAKKVSSKKVTYKTSNENVAVVDKKGNVTAKGAGTAVITVTSAVNKKAKAKFTVTVNGQGETTVNPVEDKCVYGDFTIDKEPTCTEDGEKSKHCTKHGERKEVTTIPKLGHSYKDGVCTACGDTTETIPQIGGLKDGGSYQTGTTLNVGEGEELEINGEKVDLINGGYTFEEAGEYEVTLTDKDGNKTVIQFVIKEDADMDSEDLIDGGTYQPGTSISGSEEKDIYVNGVKLDKGDTFDFDEEGEYEIVTVDKDGNKTITIIRIEHRHVYNEGVITTEAACTTAGVKTISCEICGISYAEPVPAKGHNMDEWETVKSPNCTDKGSQMRACADCDFVETKDVDAAGHSWKTEPEIDKEATCETDGSKSIHCKNCTATKDSEVIPATGHAYDNGKVTLKQTCTENGTKLFSCNNCDMSYEVVIPADGHSYGEYETTKQPTCTQKGSKNRVCSVCNAADTADIAALGHDYAQEFTTDQAATCEADGQKSKHCSRCDSVIEVTVLTKLGHDMGDWVIDVELTCQTDEQRHRDCKRTGCDFTETKTTEKTADQNHKYSTSFTVDTEATCTANGSKSKHCTVPGCNSKTEVTAIAAAGHFYGEWETVTSPNCTDKGSEKRTCSTCGNIETRDLAASGHTWASDYTVDKADTCTEDGSESIHCTKCSASKDSRPIEALGHSYGQWSTTKAATCTAAGSHKRTCFRCSDVDTQSIAALGHSYSSAYTTDTAATCTATGTKSYHCTRSGCTAKTGSTSIAALGHSYGSWSTTKAATCVATGTKQRTCSRCSNKETQTIAKLTTHTYSSSYTTDTAATCTTAGSKSKHCTVSGCTAKTGVTSVAALGHTIALNQWNNPYCTRCNTYDIGNMLNCTANNGISIISSVCVGNKVVINASIPASVAGSLQMGNFIKCSVIDNKTVVGDLSVSNIGSGTVSPTNTTLTVNDGYYHIVPCMYVSGVDPAMVRFVFDISDVAFGTCYRDLPPISSVSNSVYIDYYYRSGNTVTIRGKLKGISGSIDIHTTFGNTAYDLSMANGMVEFDSIKYNGVLKSSGASWGANSGTSGTINLTGGAAAGVVTDFEIQFTTN